MCTACCNILYLIHDLQRCNLYLVFRVINFFCTKGTYACIAPGIQLTGFGQGECHIFAAAGNFADTFHHLCRFGLIGFAIVIDTVCLLNAQLRISIIAPGIQGTIGCDCHGVILTGININHIFHQLIGQRHAGISIFISLVTFAVGNTQCTIFISAPDIQHTIGINCHGMIGACCHHGYIFHHFFRFHAADVHAVTHLITGIVTPGIQVTVFAAGKGEFISCFYLNGSTRHFDLDRCGFVVTSHITQFTLDVVSPGIYIAACINCQHMVFPNSHIISCHFFCGTVAAQTDKHGYGKNHNDNRSAEHHGNGTISFF